MCALYLIFNFLMNWVHKILENISFFGFFNMCSKGTS